MTQKLCTESKTGSSVEGAHIEPLLRAWCVQAERTAPQPRALRCVVVRSGAVSAAGHVASLGGRIVALCRALLRALCCAYRSSVRCIVALLRAISQYNLTAKLPPITIQFIVS